MKFHNSIINISILYILTILLLGCKESDVQGIYIGETLNAHLNYDKQTKLRTLIEGSIKKDSTSIENLINFKINGGASGYDLGFILSQIVYRIGEKEIVSLIQNLEFSTQMKFKSLVDVGLEYGDQNNDKIQDNSRLKIEFPILSKLFEDSKLMEEHKKQTSEINERQQKHREFMGLNELYSIIPNSLDDIYFRIIEIGSKNLTFTIHEITNIDVQTPSLKKRKYKFDYDCNYVSGKKKLTKDCFTELYNKNKEIKVSELNHLKEVLNNYEFWNIRAETFNQDQFIILGGGGIEISGVIGKFMQGTDSIGRHKNTINRELYSNNVVIESIIKTINQISDTKSDR